MGKRPLHFLALALLAGFLLGFRPAAAERQTVVLYDGRLGGTPDQQSLAYISLFSTAATQRYVDGTTVLDTVGVTADQAGYFAPSSLILDRREGFTITFSGQLLQEAHSNRNRAGFTLLFISSDLRGLEVAFWEDEVWVQEGGTEALFTRAEGVALDTTAVPRTYEITVLDDAYSLLADGEAVLSGALRDYTAFDGFPDVYETPNLLFLGDNTRRAGAETALAYVAVETVLTATSTPAASPTSSATSPPPPTRTPRPTATMRATAVPTSTPLPTPLPLPTPTPEPLPWYLWWLPWLR